MLSLIGFWRAPHRFSPQKAPALRKESTRECERERARDGRRLEPLGACRHRLEARARAAVHACAPPSSCWSLAPGVSPTPSTKTSQRGHLLSTKLPSRVAAAFQSVAGLKVGGPLPGESQLARKGCDCRSTPMTFHCEHSTSAMCAHERCTCSSETSPEYHSPDPGWPGAAENVSRSHARTISCPRRAAALAIVVKTFTYRRCKSSGASLTWCESMTMAFRNMRSWSKGRRIPLNECCCRKVR